VVSYTDKQQELRWCKYGFKNQGGMYYDRKNDVFYWMVDDDLVKPALD
jgi:hypothetical protein